MEDEKIDYGSYIDEMQKSVVYHYGQLMYQRDSLDGQISDNNNQITTINKNNKRLSVKIEKIDNELAPVIRVMRLFGMDVREK